MDQSTQVLFYWISKTEALPNAVREKCGQRGFCRATIETPHPPTTESALVVNPLCKLPFCRVTCTWNSKNVYSTLDQLDQSVFIGTVWIELRLYRFTIMWTRFLYLVNLTRSTNSCVERCHVIKLFLSDTRLSTDPWIPLQTQLLSAKRCSNKRFYITLQRKACSQRERTRESQYPRR